MNMLQPFSMTKKLKDIKGMSILNLYQRKNVILLFQKDS
jgi:hypothetical protein